MLTKQERINSFLRDLAEFFERYYSKGVNDISVIEESDVTNVTITGEYDSSIQLGSWDAEVTIIFGESHWHINNYSEPCDMELIYWNTIHIVMSILDGECGTYSCWLDEHHLGGASFFSATQEEIINAAKKYFTKSTSLKIKLWGKTLDVVNIE